VDIETDPLPGRAAASVVFLCFPRVTEADLAGNVVHMRRRWKSIQSKRAYVPTTSLVILGFDTAIKGPPIALTARNLSVDRRHNGLVCATIGGIFLETTILQEQGFSLNCP
jgi:hypothetical protein